jgi:predicted MFS family arabinose efflux permease
MFGSRVSTIAFPMLVLGLSRSPFTAGFLLFAAIVPSMFIYVPAGALVDRLNLIKVLLISELGRGIIIALVVVWLSVGKPSVFFLVLAMIVEEILEIFSTLADRRYVNSLVAQEDTSRAQARMEVRTHVAVLAGRPIGSFLFEISPIVPFLADAMSFVVSVASILYIKLSPWTSPQHRAEPLSTPRMLQSVRRPFLSGQHLIGDISDGFRWLRNEKYARVMMVMMASTTLIAQALIMVFLAAAQLHQLSKTAIGVGLAASGAGGIFGSMVAKWISRLVKDSWLPIQLCAWCVALGLVAMSGGSSVPWIAFAMVVLGLTGAIGNVQFGTHIVEHVPDGRIARVTSIGAVLAIGASALGPVLGGWAIEQHGIHGAVVLLFVVEVPMAVISLFAPRPEGNPAVALWWRRRGQQGVASSPSVVSDASRYGGCIQDAA